MAAIWLALKAVMAVPELVMPVFCALAKKHQKNTKKKDDKNLFMVCKRNS